MNDEFSLPTGQGPTTAEINAESRLARTWKAALLSLFEKVNTEINLKSGQQARRAFQHRKFKPVLREKQNVRDEITLPWANVYGTDLVDIRDLVSEALEHIWNELRGDPGLDLAAASSIHIGKIDGNFQWIQPGREFEVLYRYNAHFRYPTQDHTSRTCMEEGVVAISSQPPRLFDHERLKVIRDPSGDTMAAFTAGDMPVVQLRDISEQALKSLGGETATFQSDLAALASSSQGLEGYVQGSSWSTASVTQFTPGSSVYDGRY